MSLLRLDHVDKVVKSGGESCIIVDENILFLATEYGVYVSLNQGEEWHDFSRGLPTISVRDLAIQKRENDLVLAILDLNRILD